MARISGAFEMPVFGSSGAKGKTRYDMTLDYILGAAATICVTVYLVYALLRPERF